MRNLSRRPFAMLLIAIVSVCVMQSRPIAAQGNVLRAQALIHGSLGSGITGVIRFTQAPSQSGLPEPTVNVDARIDGLPPGLHGIHIHEFGNCDSVTGPFSGAGGHFDPGPFGNSNPDANHPFHMGDIPNLDVNPAGIGRLQHVTSRITLSPGPLSVFDSNGSAVVVHLNVDQGVPGVAGSGVSGGPRIACGIIEVL
jgi:superoxide dismutase, Cu-Zn family